MNSELFPVIAAFIDGADHGVIIIDPKGNIIAWNKWVAKYSGINAKDAVGKRMDEVMNLKKNCRIMAAIKGALDAGQSSILSQAFDPHPLPLHRGPTSKDLMTQKIVVQSKVIKSLGRHCFVEIIDFSAAAQREKYLSLANKKIAEQKATLLNTAKLSALGEMAGGIAHEINNPLAIIKASVHRISSVLKNKKLSAEAKAEKIAHYAETAENTVMRIASIVKGMRTIARSETIEVSKETEIQTIIDDTMSLCAEKFKSQGIDVQLNIDCSETSVFCSSVQISQALLNLLNNSFDAIIGLSERWIKISATDGPENYIDLTIVDSGSGIPRAIQEKILEPFYTTKEIGKGTGLGLGITKSLIEGHGGKFMLNVDSPNTSFTMLIPKKLHSQSEASEEELKAKSQHAEASINAKESA